uniref:Adenosine deaminase domain-containing protein n=1 Tax=Amphimedon queenslandica TaxID=400682 RepID=A0A1X7VXT1_AMPQE
MLEFCQLLPKVELHAHLNGSISADTMRKLIELKSKKRLLGGKDEVVSGDSNPNSWKTVMSDEGEKLESGYCTGTGSCVMVPAQ